MIDFYNAFISYKHAPLDSKVAEDVQRSLEHFRIPSSIRKKTGKKKIERIFRDKDELPITSDLTNTISNALEKADYLIVICSPNTKESMWVKREIQFFLKNHTKNQILTVLAGGEPQDVIPDELKNDERIVENELGMKYSVKVPIEPLSCDYRMPFKRAHKEELPRLAAALIGCSYDELVRRQRQYKMRRMGILFAAIMAVILAFGGYMLYSKIQIDKSYKQTLANQSRYLANESQRLLENQQRIPALQLALAALPEDENDDRPVTAEAVRALTYATLAYRPINGLSIDSKWDYQMGNNIADFIVSDDGNFLAARDNTNAVEVWNTKDHSQILLKNFSQVNGITFLKDGGLAVWNSNMIVVFNIPDASIRWKCELDKSAYRQEDKLMKTADSVMMIDFDDKIIRFDAASGKITAKYVLPATNLSNAGSYQDFCLSPDEKRIAFVYSDLDGYKVGLYDIDAGNCRFSEVQKLRIADITWGDDNHIVTATPATDIGTSGTMGTNTILRTDHNIIKCYDPNSLIKRWESEITSVGVMTNSNFLCLPAQHAVAYYHADAANIYDLDTGRKIHGGNVYDTIIDASDRDGDGWPLYITKAGDLASPTANISSDAFSNTSAFTGNIYKALVNRGVYVCENHSSRIIYYETYVCDDEWQEIDDGMTYPAVDQDTYSDGKILATIYSEDNVTKVALYDIEECTFMRVADFPEMETLTKLVVMGRQDNDLYVISKDLKNLSLYIVDISTGEVSTKSLGSLDYYVDDKLLATYSDGKLCYIEKEADDYIVSVYNIKDERKHSVKLGIKPKIKLAPIYLPVSGDVYIGDESGDYLVSMDKEEVTKIDIADGFTGAVQAAENKDGRTVAVGDNSGVFLIDRDTMESRRISVGGLTPIGIVFHQMKGDDHETLFVAYNNGYLYRYDPVSGEMLGRSSISYYNNFSFDAEFEFDDEKGFVYIHIGEMIDVIETETWIETAAVENCVGHSTASDRFISFNYKGGSDLELGYFKHYSLDDLIAKAKAMLEGTEMSEDMKSQYGI